MRFYLSLFFMLSIGIFQNLYAEEKQSVYSFDKSRFEKGEKKSVVCQVCHGKDGIAYHSTYPNLQGQQVDYMVSALKAYKAGNRRSGLAPLMYGQVEHLSEQDMKDIAYYYSHIIINKK